MSYEIFYDRSIRIITKLPNIEQSSKGKGKTHKSINSKISQQPENWENCNGPDLVQAFPKKWWVESDFTAPNLPLPLRLKGSGCHYISIFNNAGIHIWMLGNNRFMETIMVLRPFCLLASKYFLFIWLSILWLWASLTKAISETRRAY